MLKKLFDICSINLEDAVDSTGSTSLLRCSCVSDPGGGIDPQCLKFLLDRGANVKARDVYGRTSLHLVVGATYRPHQINAIRTSLIHLIHAGADFYATMNDRGSVSDIAYCELVGGTKISMGGVFEEALSACGYDAMSFREDFCRCNNAVIEDREECFDSDVRDWDYISQTWKTERVKFKALRLVTFMNEPCGSGMQKTVNQAHERLDIQGHLTKFHIYQMISSNPNSIEEQQHPLNIEFPRHNHVVDLIPPQKLPKNYQTAQISIDTPGNSLQNQPSIQPKDYLAQKLGFKDADRLLDFYLPRRTRPLDGF